MAIIKGFFKQNKKKWKNVETSVDEIQISWYINTCPNEGKRNKQHNKDKNKNKKC